MLSHILPALHRPICSEAETVSVSKMQEDVVQTPNQSMPLRRPTDSQSIGAVPEFLAECGEKGIFETEETDRRWTEKG